MSTELMIPEDVQKYLAAAKAQTATDEFLAGISFQKVPTVKLKGTRFVIVEDDGFEKVLDATHIIVAILAGRPRQNMKKSYYVNPYVEGDENKAPDCWSEMGIKPDPSVADPVCDNCATCPMNQFNTARGQGSDPGKGKACTDKKVIAIFPGKKAYKFEIPPASFVHFDEYTKDLRAHGVLPFQAMTKIAFDLTVSYPKLTFERVKNIEDKDLGQIIQLRESAEVKAIINPDAATPTLQAASQPVAQPQPTPEPEPVKEPEVVLERFDIPGFENPHREPGKASPGSARRTKAEMAEDEEYEKAQNPEPVEVAASGDGFGLDTGTTQEPEPVAQTQSTVAPDTADQDLAATLGLSF